MVRHGNRFRNSWWSAEFVYLRTAICCQSMSILYPISKQLSCFFWRLGLLDTNIKLCWWSKSKWLQIFWINVTVSFPTKYWGPKKIDVFVRNVIVATGGQAPFCHTNNEIMIIWSWLDIEHYCILLVFFCVIHNPRLWTQTTQRYAAKSHHLGSFDWGGGVSGKAVVSMNQFLPNEAGSCTFAKNWQKPLP